MDGGTTDAMGDASPDASPHFDAGPWDAAGDGGPCDPNILVFGCSSDQECAARAAYVAPPGVYPVTECGGHVCQQGTYHCTTHDGNTQCLCGPQTGVLGFACGTGQLCVSDTPGGPTRCVNACEGR